MHDTGDDDDDDADDDADDIWIIFITSTAESEHRATQRITS